jgi:hypothetical protein
MKKIALKLFVFLALCVPLICHAQIERCQIPDKSFKAFFGRFVDDLQFQRSRIIFPLMYRYGDYTITNPTIELWDLKKVESLADPLIRNMKQRKSENIAQSFLLVTNRYSEVFHDVPNGDYERVLYKFRNINSCWYLEEVHDKSE